ncbi:MAG: hypothetical protein WC435_02295 [Candidatus Paceibacterota bacterium]
MGKSKEQNDGMVVMEKPKAPEGTCRCCGIKIAVGEVKKSEPGYCLSCSQKIWRARKIGEGTCIKMVFA